MAAPSERELRESLAACEKQIMLLERIMRIEAADPKYQDGPGGQAMLKQRTGYYELQLRQERALQAKMLIALSNQDEESILEPEDDQAAQAAQEAQEAALGYELDNAANEAAALEEAHIIESFIRYFRKEFYGSGEFSENSLRQGGKDRKYYDGVFSQMYKDALIYRKRAFELGAECPDNKRIADLSPRMDACVAQMDRLDRVLASLKSAPRPESASL